MKKNYLIYYILIGYSILCDAIVVYLGTLYIRLGVEKTIIIGILLFLQVAFELSIKILFFLGKETSEIRRTMIDLVLFIEITGMGIETGLIINNTAKANWIGFTLTWISIIYMYICKRIKEKSLRCNG